MEELRIKQIPIPTLQADNKKHDAQVVVKVEACGCNFFDILMCQGKYQVKPKLPFTPGSEFAGVVHAVGKKVSHLKVGDRVVGFVPFGAFTQYLLVPAMTLIKIPKQMSFAEAAAFVMTNATSMMALQYRTQVTADDIVLVHAAAGGVGIAAVQIAKAAGATVIGTVGSQEKEHIAKQYGCDHVINYSTDKNWEQTVLTLTNKKGATVIYDSIGGETFHKSMKCIAWGGRILIIGFAGGNIADVSTNRILLKNISVVGVFFGSYSQYRPDVMAECVQKCFALYKEGKLKSVICGSYGLDETSLALKLLGTRKTYGKVIIEPHRFKNASASTSTSATSLSAKL